MNKEFFKIIKIVILFCIFLFLVYINIKAIKLVSILNLLINILFLFKYKNLFGINEQIYNFTFYLFSIVIILLDILFLENKIFDYLLIIFLSLTLFYLQRRYDQLYYLNVQNSINI